MLTQWEILIQVQRAIAALDPPISNPAYAMAVLKALEARMPADPPLERGEAALLAPWATSPPIDDDEPDEGPEQIPVEPGTTMIVDGQEFGVVEMKRVGSDLYVKTADGRHIKFVNVGPAVAVRIAGASETAGPLTLDLGAGPEFRNDL